MPYEGYCTDARSLLRIPESVQCCASCHSEDEDGYEMCSRMIDDKEYYVCCTVANYEESPAPATPREDT